MTLSILIVEDDPSMAALFEEFLKDEGYTITHVDSGKKALQHLKGDGADIILLDYKLPDMTGLDVLKAMHSDGLAGTPIMITSQGSLNTAIEAMKHGARDFLIKPCTKERLITTIKNVGDVVQLKQTVKTYEKETNRNNFCNFIGASLPMQNVYRIIESAAPSKASVFITGESGTGKELCAEALHLSSPRKNNNLAILNCGAIPKDLMESEIFGHVKGAFTGAHSDRAGLAAEADGGTMFLDEIGEMDMALQVKLLRFIQTGTYSKVGSPKTEKVDIRFVCATNRDPLAEVKAGNFREDLYYRLHVVPIHMPPLRERGDDIVLLAEHFLKTFSQEENKNFTGFEKDVQKTLTDYPWRGNIRELQNVIRNAVVLNNGEMITREMLSLN